MQIMPNNKNRLQTTAIVDAVELASVHRDEIMRRAALNMAEDALRKIMADCVVVEPFREDIKGYRLVLDMYVLSPAELENLLYDARKQGQIDAQRWQLPYVEK